jgi:uroporphyrinogen decarboxylase
MAAEMTPRERMRTALNHQEPDRVPIALGGGPYGMVDPLYFALLRHFGLGDPVAPFRAGHSISYLDDRLLARLGVDTRYVYPATSPSSPTHQGDDPDRFYDGYGQAWIRAEPYYYAAEGLLADATAINDIDSRVQWPDARAPEWTTGVAERARALYEDTDCYVVARMVTSHGPFQTACNLRGTETLLIDLALNPDFAKALIDRITDSTCDLLHGYLEACGRYIDMIELPGDDYAGNESLVISPGMFRAFIKPALRRLVETIKTFRPEIKVMLHSDGMISALLPDLIEVGIDVVHPLEPLPAMDLPAIKATFGGRLAFLGAIDIVGAMRGSVQDVENEVRRRVAQLAPGGGYVLAPSNHLQRDVPPENVIALCEAARAFGVYPIARALAAS